MSAPVSPVVTPERIDSVRARARGAATAAELACVLRDAGDVGRGKLVQLLLDESVECLRSEPRRSLVLARAASSEARAAADVARLAAAQSLAGQALVIAGRCRLGLGLLDRALAHLMADGPSPAAGRIEVRRMYALSELGRYEAARFAGERARSLFQATDDVMGLVQADVALGRLASRRDDHRAAAWHYRRARVALGERGKAVGRAIIDMNLAVCLEARHRYGAAQRYLARARALFDDEEQNTLVAQIDANRAHLAFVRGLYAEALRLYLGAEATFRAAADGRSLAQCHLERADLLLQMGMPGEARDLARQAAVEFEREGVRKERAQAWLAAGVADLLEDESARAEEALESARRIFEEDGNVVWAAEAELLLAMAAMERGDPSLARSLASNAQETFLRESRTARAGSADILLARIDLDSGFAARALAQLDRAEERTRGLDAPWLRVELARFRGLAHLALGRSEQGVAALEDAVGMLETHRGALPSDEFMVAFLASKAALYAETVDALARVGRHRDAFEFCERAKSRALVDMLSRRGAGAAGPRGSLRDVRIQAHRQRLNALYTRLHRVAIGTEQVADDREAALREQLAIDERELARLLRQRWSADPEIASVDAVGALGLESVQELLDDETTLVEYFLTGSRLYAFTVRRDGFRCHAIDVREEQLLRLVQRFRFHLAKFNLPPEKRRLDEATMLAATRANLSALHMILIEPVQAELRGRRVVFVPHGILHGFPFHALPEGDGWFADRHDIWYAPSATVFGFCARKGPRAEGPAGVFALPDEAAPEIAAEAVAVGRALDGAQVHIGDEATSDRLREAAATSRVLHVATHGQFRRDQPSLSSIRLADGWMNVYDVYELDVRAELVTLAACESGVAEVTGGDEMLGLLRGFLFAGAPRLLASQWRVHDEATALFMEALYRAHREERSWERAVRVAIATVRARHPHPYYWAPFFLVGYPDSLMRDGTTTHHRPRPGGQAVGALNGRSL